MQTEAHCLPVCRSVERHSVRAGLVSQADHWRWGSLWQRVQGDGDTLGMLSAWPVDPPDAWGHWVNTPLPAAEWQALRHSVTRGQPFGTLAWQQQTAVQLGVTSTFRPRGRPRHTPSQDAAPLQLRTRQ